jgi:xanthine dehydrogenase YagS FAD-binding subunit
VAAVPWPLDAALASMQGTRPDADAFAAVAREALAPAEPLRMNAYKVPLAQALIRRALHMLAA